MTYKNNKDKVSFPDIFEEPFYIWFEDYVKGLNLPISYTENFIGVGKVKDMYLFWITKKESQYIFNSRRELVKSLKDNRKQTLFAEENKDQIIYTISQLLFRRDKLLDDNDLADEDDEANDVKDTDSLERAAHDDDYEDYTHFKLVASLLESLKAKVAKSPDVIFNYPSYISNRLRNCLCRHGYLNFNDLSNAKVEDLFEMNYFGRKSVEELVSILTNFEPNEVKIVKESHEEIKKLEFELKLTPLVLYDEVFSKSSIVDVDEQKIEFYQAIVNDYIECINNSIKNCISLREIEFMKKYYFSDCKVTLQTVGDEFGVTRERVRQVLKKTSKKLLSQFNRKTNFSNRGRAIYLFNQIETDDFINFIKYGFLLNMNRPAVKFYLRFLYQEDVVDKILDYCDDSIKHKAARQDRYEDFINRCAVFPSGAECSVRPEDIESVEDLKYSYLSNAMKKFMNMPKVTKVIARPNLYYYESSATKHNPDFALVCGEKIILVIVLNTINLGFYYNVKRFNALHQFCSKNGFGYIIINERFRSYQEVRNTEVEPELEGCLLGILEKNGVIEWRDIRALKSEYKITNEKIVAFVARNKLKFTLNPFSIKKRQLKV